MMHPRGFGNYRRKIVRSLSDFSISADEASKFSFTNADITLGSLLLFSLLSSLVITLGRIGFGQLIWAIGSRYVTITSLGVASIYMLLSNMANSTRRFSFLFTCFLVVLVTGLALSYQAGFHMGQVKYAQMLRMQYALQNYQRQPDSALANIYASPQSVRNQAEYLKEQELSAFSQSTDLVLFTVSGQGLPLGEILPDYPAVQRFNCPVSTLRDIGILFATYGRHNNSTIRITLTDNDETVWQHALSTAVLADNTFQRFPLPEPIQTCRGHNLILRIDSLDGTPGNAVTVWTYPAYYDARLIDPSIPSLEGQVIGLELNARAYGLARCDTCE